MPHILQLWIYTNIRFYTGKFRKTRQQRGRIRLRISPSRPQDQDLHRPGKEHQKVLILVIRHNFYHIPHPVRNLVNRRIRLLRVGPVAQI